MQYLDKFWLNYPLEANILGTTDSLQTIVTGFAAIASVILFYQKEALNEPKVGS